MKSLEAKFSEAMDALKKAGKASQFEAKLNPIKETAEASGKTVAIEVQLNCAEAVLKDAGIVRESKPPIKMHNGAGDRFIEGNPFGPTVEDFRESSNNFSPGYIKESTNPFAKTDAIMIDNMTHPVTKQPLTEAEKRKLLGTKPLEYDNLSEAQKNEFDFARAIGISEADAFKLANLASRQVSRR